VRLKSCGISGRRTDFRCCFLHQCAHWFRKTRSHRQVGGNDRALKNPEGFFNAKEEELRAPEILRDFRAAH